MKEVSNMNLYEITDALEHIERLMAEATTVETKVDEATGEVLETWEVFDGQKFAELIESLELAKDVKVEAALMAYKNRTAMINAIKAEEKLLSARRKSKENEAERLKNFVTYILNGDRFETAKVSVTWRKSEKLEVTNEEKAINWLRRHRLTDLIKKVESIKSSEVKKLVKSGTEVSGVALITNNNIQIK